MSGSGRNNVRDTAVFNERQLRDALGQFATGVAIICARAPDEHRKAASRSEVRRSGGQRSDEAASVSESYNRYAGFTANSFMSVSLDPPLILWTLSNRSTSLAAFDAAPRYAINVLSTGQVGLAQRFSRPHVDRFAGVAFRLGWSDAPLVDDCVAWFECRHHAQHRAGDHTVFIGEVVTVERARGHGLVFQHGRFAAATPLVDQALVRS